jgi:GNAT superfamily N-acetyltransferase/RimJ/RimL family protein N-acetyltransferase
MKLRLTQFDGKADAASLQICFDIFIAGRPIDNPNEPPESLASFTGWWAHGFDGSPRQTWLGYADDGQPVCCCLIILPDRENQAMARCFPYVLPVRRREGFGTALLEHCADQARLAGRTRMVSYVRDGSPGAAFAAAVGARGGIDEVMRVMDVDASLPSRLAPLRAAARPAASGYDLMSWVGVTPEEDLDPVARLHAVMADAPRDEGVEPMRWDGDRVRHMDQVLVEQGLQIYTVVAREAATGEFAAITQISTDPAEPEWGFQEMTAVGPAHRGHRLGLLVKIAMLDLLAEHEPAIRRIYTGNAGSNSHMIAINEQLGYYISDVHRAWELDLAAGLD